MKSTPLLSILIPCFNEIKTLDTIIGLINSTSYPNKEIIVVDDFSTDGSREKLVEFEKSNMVSKVICHKKNLGKGAAIRTALNHSNGDILIIQDADLEYDPNEYELLINPILQGKADVVYGSRFNSNNSRRVLYFWHSLANKIITLLSNFFTNLNFTDIETCYKAFTKEIISQITIEENRFGFEPEVTAKISKLRCDIYEVGISYYGRTYKQGKKITWKDGLSALRCIIKYNLFR